MFLKAKNSQWKMIAVDIYHTSNAILINDNRYLKTFFCNLIRIGLILASLIFLVFILDLQCEILYSKENNYLTNFQFDWTNIGGSYPKMLKIMDLTL